MCLQVRPLRAIEKRKWLCPKTRRHKSQNDQVSLAIHRPEDKHGEEARLPWIWGVSLVHRSVRRTVLCNDPTERTIQRRGRKDWPHSKYSLWLLRQYARRSILGTKVWSLGAILARLHRHAHPTLDFYHQLCSQQSVECAWIAIDSQLSKRTGLKSIRIQ